MRAHARKHEDIPAKKRRSKRKLLTRTTPPPPPPPVPPAPAPPGNPDIHYEAAWTDSWQHRRCLHKHTNLIEAAQCAKPHGCGWYVFAVENGKGRELDEKEDEIVNGYRFRR
jgi:hypothetical protein